MPSSLYNEFSIIVYANMRIIDIDLYKILLIENNSIGMFFKKSELLNDIHMSQ